MVRAGSRPVEAARARPSRHCAAAESLVAGRLRAPGLEAVAHNGGESARSAKLTAALGVAVHRLPSTSPANASWSFERKRAAWAAVFTQHGLA